MHLSNILKDFLFVINLKFNVLIYFLNSLIRATEARIKNPCPEGAGLNLDHMPGTNPSSGIC